MKTQSDPEAAGPGSAASERADHYRAGFLFNDATLEEHATAIRTGLSHLQASIRKSQRPFSGVRPQDLARRFEPVDLDVPCGGLGAALEEMQALYLDHAVYYHRPQYLAHLNCPVALPAAVGELVQGTVNTAVETWDQSGGGTLIEQKLIDWTADRIGFDRQADGVFTSGGTQSNLMALLLARDIYCRDRLSLPDVQRRGLPWEAGRLRILTSEVSHFSVQKAAGVLGLGHDAVVSVACDTQYRMDPAALERRIEASLADGAVPMCVVATVGTTDFGSIDPLHAVADLCRRYGMRMHVDAAYGCGLLVSPDNAAMVAGIERADSVTVDYHKSFFQPVSCSALLARDRRDLSVVAWHADYLNPRDEAAAGVPNLVDKSLQTTRRFDALKLWLTLRALGPEAIGRAFDRLLALAAQVYELLRGDAKFEVAHRPTLSTLVFRYRPHGCPGGTRLDAVNRAIRQALLDSGEAVIATTRIRGEEYLKFTLLSPETTLGEVRRIVDSIRRYGDEHLASTADPARTAARSSEEEKAG